MEHNPSTPKPNFQRRTRSTHPLGAGLKPAPTSFAFFAVPLLIRGKDRVKPNLFVHKQSFGGELGYLQIWFQSASSTRMRRRVSGFLRT
jgi:hypothetical protein